MGHHPTQPCCLKSQLDFKSDIWVSAAILDSGMAALEESTDLWFWPSPLCNQDISASHRPFSRYGPEGPPWMLDYVLIHIFSDIFEVIRHIRTEDLIPVAAVTKQHYYPFSEWVTGWSLNVFKSLDFGMIHIKDFWTIKEKQNTCITLKNRFILWLSLIET